MLEKKCQLLIVHKTVFSVKDCASVAMSASTCSPNFYQRHICHQEALSAVWLQAKPKITQEVEGVQGCSSGSLP